jgi:hypothetical protein
METVTDAGAIPSAREWFLNTGTVVPLRPWTARTALGTLLVLLLIGVAPGSRPQARRLPPPGAGDALLHLTTIDRLRSGEPYYDAVGEELRRGHYPTTSVFNWRTPAHFQVVATLSVPVARVILRVLAMAAVMWTPVALAGESVGVALIGLGVQLGAVATSFRPLAVGVAEVWAGALIALSICAYLSERWQLAAALGVAAVFTRELAVPYAITCGLMAFSAGRRRESYIWTAGALAYAAYFGVHVMQVRAHQLPGDLTQLESWIRWNGLRFTLDTVRVNGWIALAPAWAAAAYAVLALAGIASRNIPPQITGPLLGYFVLFAFVGQPFNYYWGFVTAPIWAFASAYGVDGFRRLIVSARRSTLTITMQTS